MVEQKVCFNNDIEVTIKCKESEDYFCVSGHNHTITYHIHHNGGSWVAKTMTDVKKVVSDILIEIREKEFREKRETDIAQEAAMELCKELKEYGLQQVQVRTSVYLRSHKRRMRGAKG